MNDPVSTSSRGGVISMFTLVGREGFEPTKAEPADLQSAPFGRLGTDPTCVVFAGEA